MIARIESVHKSNRAVEIQPVDADHVSIAIDEPGRFYGDVTVSRVDLLDALRTVLDAIVIERADVPPVKLTARGLKLATLGGDWPLTTKPGMYWDQAVAMLALHEYQQHPPVDEREVEALGGLVRDLLGVTPETVAAGSLRQGNSTDLARRLLATGRVHVDTEGAEK